MVSSSFHDEIADSIAEPAAPASFPGDIADDAAEPPEIARKDRASRIWRNLFIALREVIETIILTLVIFFFIQLVVRNFRVVGSSMEPTLHDTQHLLVDKLSYRLHPPERGDIVVFHFPQDPSRDYIKRVIGLEGETVEIRDGKVYINGKLLKEPYQLNPGSYSSKAVVVPPEALFVLGDNRNNSSDSHSWGTLPQDQIVGKAWFSYWPPGMWGLVSHESFATQ
jgi:signal peptidase I